MKKYILILALLALIGCKNKPPSTSLTAIDTIQANDYAKLEILAKFSDVVLRPLPDSTFEVLSVDKISPNGKRQDIERLDNSGIVINVGKKADPKIIVGSEVTESPKKDKSKTDNSIDQSRDSGLSVGAIAVITGIVGVLVFLFFFFRKKLF